MSILLAQAPRAPEYVMPNFVGRQLSEAREKIARAGLQLTSVSVAGGDDQMASTADAGSTPQLAPLPKLSSTSGKITGQSPPAGSRVTPETPIRLEIVP
jgi:beta-lactam-binding protein with PASTA domain